MRFRWFIALLVFGPWLLIAAESGVLFWATSRGCSISAQGPSPCFLWGRDIGEQLYPLWSIGYQIAGSLLWVVPGAIIWGLIELAWLFKRRRIANGSGDYRGGG